VEVHRSVAGSLGVVHLSDLPFETKRVYWIMDSPLDIVRGLHAHKELEQFIYCVNGKVSVLIDDGASQVNHELFAGGPGLHILPGCWRVLSGFAESTVLLVFASTCYEPNDYIHDYQEFLSWTRRSD